MRGCRPFPHFQPIRALAYKVQTYTHQNGEAEENGTTTTTTCRNPAFMASDPFRCVLCSSIPQQIGDVVDISTPFADTAIGGMSSPLFNGPLFYKGRFDGTLI